MEPPLCTIDDMKMHLSVLISHGAIAQAFDFQRRRQNESCGAELLNHLFMGCQETYKLKDVMYLPLNHLESSSLVKFLSENEDSRAQEALVMYHLLRCNFFEAQKVEEKLSTKSLKRTSSTKERAADRGALVESFMMAVHKSEKHLIEEIKRYPVSTSQIEESVQPLSVNVKCSSFEAVTYSDILHSLISNASSAMTASYSDPKTPLCTRNKLTVEEMPFVRQPVTPQVLKFSPEVKSSVTVPKRTLSSPNLNEFHSPSKKSRLLDNSSFKSSPMFSRRIPKHLAGEVASLLQSPPIRRRSTKSFTDIRQSAQKLAPHSILKKTVLPDSPSQEFFEAVTPSSLSETDEKSEDEKEPDILMPEIEMGTSLKQIRFSEPMERASFLKTVDASLKSSSFERSSKSLIANSPKELDVKKFSESPDIDPVKETNVSNLSSTKLTREPLKSYSKDSLKSPAQIQVLEESTISKNVICSTPIEDKSQSACITGVDELKSPSEERVLEKMDVSTFEDAEENISEVIAQKSVHITSLKSTDFDTVMHSDEPFIVDAKNSSSGNSSYNSANESLLGVCPRQPIRSSPPERDLEVLTSEAKSDEFVCESLDTASECEKSFPLPSKIKFSLIPDPTNDDMKKLNRDSIHSSSIQFSNRKSADSFDQRFPRLSMKPFKTITLEEHTESLLKELDELFAEKPEEHSIKMKNTGKKFTFSSRLTCHETIPSIEGNLSLDTCDSVMKDISSKQSNKAVASTCDETYEEFSLALHKETMQDLKCDYDCPMTFKSSPKVESVKEDTDAVIKIPSFKFTKPNIQLESVIQSSLKEDRILADINTLNNECQFESEMVFTFDDPLIDESYVSLKEQPVESSNKSVTEGRKSEHTEQPVESSNKSVSKVTKGRKTVKKTTSENTSSADIHSTSKTSKKPKSKIKGKIEKKREFFFAEPHSPTDPEILEALTTPSEEPVPTFMFSPPLTRGRLRQKTLDGTLNASNISEVSFIESKKPPIDSLLQSIIQEKSSEILNSPSTKKAKVAFKKKSTVKKSRILPQKISVVASPTLEPIEEVHFKTPKSSTLKNVARHSMITRQSLSGHKASKL